MKLSIVVVARNEAEQLADCLSTAAFADETVVVLDRCTDNSAEIARRFTDHVIEGAWEIQGDRRHAGFDAAAGPWLIELDADERITPELAQELREVVTADPPFDYAMVPIDNYVGERLVRYGWGGSFGTSGGLRFFRKGKKLWPRERVHGRVELIGTRGPNLSGRVAHYVDKDVTDMIARLNRYTSSRARDMRDRGDMGSIPGDIRRIFGRFFKCYVMRKGYKEGAYGLLIAIMAGLFPILSTLKARLEGGK